MTHRYSWCEHNLLPAVLLQIIWQGWDKYRYFCIQINFTGQTMHRGETKEISQNACKPGKRGFIEEIKHLDDITWHHVTTQKIKVPYLGSALRIWKISNCVEMPDVNALWTKNVKKNELELEYGKRIYSIPVIPRVRSPSGNLDQEEDFSLGEYSP